MTHTQSQRLLHENVPRFTSLQDKIATGRDGRYILTLNARSTAGVHSPKDSTSDNAKATVHKTNTSKKAINVDLASFSHSNKPVIARLLQRLLRGQQTNMAIKQTLASVPVCPVTPSIDKLEDDSCAPVVPEPRHQQRDKRGLRVMAHNVVRCQGPIADVQKPECVRQLPLNELLTIPKPSQLRTFTKAPCPETLTMALQPDSIHFGFHKLKPQPPPHSNSNSNAYLNSNLNFNLNLNFIPNSNPKPVSKLKPKLKQQPKPNMQLQHVYGATASGSMSGVFIHQGRKQKQLAALLRNSSLPSMGVTKREHKLRLPTSSSPLVKLGLTSRGLREPAISVLSDDQGLEVRPDSRFNKRTLCTSLEGARVFTPPSFSELIPVLDMNYEESLKQHLMRPRCWE